MKAKRLIALALAAVFMLSAAATPVFAAAALPQENAALEQQNDMVSSISVLWWALAAKRMAM